MGLITFNSRLKNFTERDCYAKVEPSALQSQSLDALFPLALEFFAQDNEIKSQFAANDAMTGYRHIGVEYSQTPDRPDLNETFCYRFGDESLSQGNSSLGSYPLLDQCRAAQSNLDLLASEMLTVMAQDCCGEDHRAPSTKSESWLQINYSKPSTAGREYIQDAHEDGHLLTFLMANQKGLEVYSNGNWEAVTPTSDSMVCFAGDCGSMLTGDALEPMNHRVRACSDVQTRISIAYFVNPDLDQQMPPWHVNERNQNVDLLRWGQLNPTRFGLPAL